MPKNHQDGNPRLYLGAIKTGKNKLGKRLSDYLPEEKPWDRHRAQTQRVEQLYNQFSENSKYAIRLAKCAEWLRFAIDEPKLLYAYYCRVRTCPVCQWRRSMHWKARFYAAVPKIQADYPRHRWIFATFTIRNCPIQQLKANLKAINAGFKRLNELKRWPGIGWVKAVEITRNGKSGEAHPHIHCLILVSPRYFKDSYISQDLWTSLWAKSMRLDYTPIVDIRAVKSKEPDGTDGIQKAILETLKYSVKPSDLTIDADWLAEYTEQTAKSRAVSIGGVLRKYLKAEEPQPDADLVRDNLDKPGIVFNWDRQRRQYRNNRRYETGDIIL